MLFIKSKSSLEIRKGGKLILNGSSNVFNLNSTIIIGEKAVMEIGHNFSANKRSDFNCLKHIIFGNNVLLSVNLMIMDSDFHKIFDDEHTQINPNESVIVGDNVWIGCNTTILKGTQIGNNIIIGACSLLTGKYLSNNSIYVGKPAKKIMGNVTWDY